MTGTIKRVTTNFQLGIPFFNSPNWGAAIERNMNIIDAVLSTAGVVSSIVGPWESNTAYGVDDRVVDTVNQTVWQCAVAHTSGAGTFAQDRAANPTFWSSVNSSIVVREEFSTGSDYFVGDFVFDTSARLGGVVLTPFTGGAELRDNVANLGVIYDLEAVLDPIEADIIALEAEIAAAEADIIGKANLAGGNAFTHTAAPHTSFERTGSAINAVLQMITSGGSIYFGNADGVSFGVKNSANVNDAPWMRVTSAGIRTLDGSAAAPSFSFYDDPDTGIYRSASNQLAITAAGAAVLLVAGTSVQQQSGFYRNIDGGSAAVPSIQPGNDADTGIFHISANILGFTTGGVERARLSNQGLVVDVPIFAPDNTTGNATYGFAGDEDTGIRRGGTNTGMLLAGGIDLAHWNTSGITIGPTGSVFGTTETSQLNPGLISITRDSGSAGRFSRTGTDGQAVSYHKGASNVGGHSVTAAGTTFNATSDGDFKVDRVPIEEEIDLDALYDKIKIWAYTFLAIDTREPMLDLRRHGLIAQEVYAIDEIKQYATPGHGKWGDEDFRPWYLDYDGLQTVLIACIMHRQRKIEARLEALETA